MTAPLTRAALLDDKLPDGALIGASAPERTGIVHLGLGNFHRAHAAVNTALALAAEPGDWGIVGVANRSRTVVDALAAQHGLYSVLQLTPEGRSAGVVDVHRRFLVAAEDGDAVVGALADPAHRIITITVTENGYSRSARTGDLDLADPDVAADLAGEAAPRTTIGLITRGLEQRAASGAPVTVLSCDNLQAGGSTTRMLVGQFLEAAGADETVREYVASSVSFPNGMVDRIVPATTDATRDRVEELLGVRDEAPVPAEEFSMWVIEDDFAAGRPRWEAAGVIFSDEVEKYELVKLRLLNCGHSLIAYLGALDGRETIPASRGQEVIAAAVRVMLEDENLPSIDLPTGFDAQEYLDSLFHRWENHALGDRTARVGSYGHERILQRVRPPAERLLSLGTTPQQLSLLVAAWICCVVPPAGFDPGPYAAQMVEPRKEQLIAVAGDAADVRSHVEAILRSNLFPDSLVGNRAFVDRVAELAELIVTDGVRAAAADTLRHRA